MYGFLNLANVQGLMVHAGSVVHTVQVLLPGGALFTLARLSKNGVAWIAMRQLFNVMPIIMPSKTHHQQTFHAIIKAEGTKLSMPNNVGHCNVVNGTQSLANTCLHAGFMAGKEYMGFLRGAVFTFKVVSPLRQCCCKVFFDLQGYRD